MEWGYVTFGKYTNYWREEATWEQRRSKMTELKEEAAKYGFEIVFWGSPYGIDKNVCVVWRSSKPFEAYHLLPLDMIFRDAVTYPIAIQPWI